MREPSQCDIAVAKLKKLLAKKSATEITKVLTSLSLFATESASEIQACKDHLDYTTSSVNDAHMRAIEKLPEHFKSIKVRDLFQVDGEISLMSDTLMDGSTAQHWLSITIPEEMYLSKSTMHSSAKWNANGTTAKNVPNQTSSNKENPQSMTKNNSANKLPTSAAKSQQIPRTKPILTPSKAINKFKAPFVKSKPPRIPRPNEAIRYIAVSEEGSPLVTNVQQ